MARESRENNQNLDPISQEPGAHPMSTGLGAVVGGAGAGAAAGAFGGPVGALVGGVVGAVAGGLGGKAAAEAINPTDEEAFWRDNYHREPYYEAGRTFDDYGPAYRLGLEARGDYIGTFDQTESRLATHWDVRKESSSLRWDQARVATRAAWNRIDRQLESVQLGRVGSGTPQGSQDTSQGISRGAAATAHADRKDALINHTMEKHTMDNDDVIETLNDLLESCRDGEYGFRECGAHTTAQDIKTLMLRHADECRDAGVELQGLIRQLGGEPDEGGSMSGAMHRGWVSVRGTLTGYSDEGMLDECERGEDAALARYRNALKEDLPADIRAVVERQAQGAQRNHDQVKALRDAVKTAR